MTSDRRLRLAFLAGAEQRRRETHGRGLTDDELRRIIEWCKEHGVFVASNDGQSKSRRTPWP